LTARISLHDGTTRDRNIEPTAYSSNLVPSPAVFQYGGADQVKTIDINVICQSAASVTQSQSSSACTSNVILQNRDLPNQCSCGSTSRIFDATGSNAAVCFEKDQVKSPISVCIASPNFANTNPTQKPCVCIANTNDPITANTAVCSIGQKCTNQPITQVGGTVDSSPRCI